MDAELAKAIELSMVYAGQPDDLADILICAVDHDSHELRQDLQAFLGWWARAVGCRDVPAEWYSPDGLAKLPRLCIEADPCLVVQLAALHGVSAMLQ